MVGVDAKLTSRMDVVVVCETRVEFAWVTRYPQHTAERQ